LQGRPTTFVGCYAPNPSIKFLFSLCLFLLHCTPALIMENSPARGRPTLQYSCFNSLPCIRTRTTIGRRLHRILIQIRILFRAGVSVVGSLIGSSQGILLWGRAAFGGSTTLSSTRWHYCMYLYCKLSLRSSKASARQCYCSSPDLDTRYHYRGQSCAVTPSIQPAPAKSREVNFPPSERWRGEPRESRRLRPFSAAGTLSVTEQSLGHAAAPAPARQ
jgi:hypothetical protein